MGEVICVRVVGNACDSRTAILWSESDIPQYSVSRGDIAEIALGKSYILLAFLPFNKILGPDLSTLGGIQNKTHEIGRAHV